MRASITYMRGPTTPQDVISEVTTIDCRSYHGTAQEVSEYLRYHPPPTDTMEVRIVIGNTVKGPKG